MPNMHGALSAGAILALVLLPVTAMAQKQNDTLRLAMDEPFSAVSQYHTPIPSANQFAQTIYQPLISYNGHKQQFVPNLAKSWTRVDPSTLEFTLRDDIVFHNGAKFDADDVMAIIKYVIDPNVRIRFKERYTWIKSVEKLAQDKVRIVATTPTATDLGLLAHRFFMFDSEAMNSLKDKEEYGQLTPYGTGPYKVVEIDKNKGITVERFDGFKGDTTQFRAPIRRIRGIPVPDEQTQIAKLLAGEVDVITGISPDSERSISQMPGFKVTSLPSATTTFMVFDVAGVGGNKAMANLKVRKAIAMAIDREQIIKHILPGGEAAEKLGTICVSAIIGCRYNVKLPDYNPAEAKKLLAEAGYPNGFEFKIAAYMGLLDVVKAIGGELRKIGIRANIEPVQFPLLRNLQTQGQLESWFSYFPAGGDPDAGNVMETTFGGTKSKFHGNDSLFDEVTKAGLLEFDPSKRADIYAKAFDHNNEVLFTWPFSSLPNVFIHSAQLKVQSNLLNASEIYVTDYSW